MELIQTWVSHPNIPLPWFSRSPPVPQMKFFAIVALALFTTTDATSVAWGSGVANNLIQGATPTSLAIAISTDAALAASQTITLTPSSAIFAADGATTCTAVCGYYCCRHQSYLHQ